RPAETAPSAGPHPRPRAAPCVRSRPGTRTGPAPPGGGAGPAQTVRTTGSVAPGDDLRDVEGDRRTFGVVLPDVVGARHHVPSAVEGQVARGALVVDVLALLEQLLALGEGLALGAARGHVGEG